jgi:transcriptional regulator with XRE-family HTH domain
VKSSSKSRQRLSAYPSRISNKIFARRLREIRESRGLTQAQLAAKAGLQAAAISRFEAGQGASLHNLIRLAEELNCSTDALLGLGSLVYHQARTNAQIEEMAHMTDELAARFRRFKTEVA